MAKYTIKAWDNAGPVSLPEPVNIEQALARAIELRDQGFSHVVLIAVETGVEAMLEDFLGGAEADAGGT